MFFLPKSLEVGGRDYPIRSDFRTALTIFKAYNDNSLPPRLKLAVCLESLYEEIPEDIDEAAKKAMWFLDGGDMPKPKQAPGRIMDWEQDKYIIFPALNKVAGCEIRSVEYLHWWSFLGLFNEVGEGLYSQVMNIRSKLLRGKKLEKWEREFFESHKELIVLREKLTAEEQAELEKEKAFIDSLC